MTAKESLKQEIQAAFSNEPRPKEGEFTNHDCIECYKIEKDFSKFDRDKIPLDILEYHRDSLPLLSIKALKYLLPVYLNNSLDDLGSDILEFTIFHLSPEKIDDYWLKRIAGFSNNQKLVVHKYLSHLASMSELNHYKEDIKRGLNIWSK